MPSKRPLDKNAQQVCDAILLYIKSNGMTHYSAKEPIDLAEIKPEKLEWIMYRNFKEEKALLEQIVHIYTVDSPQDFFNLLVNTQHVWLQNLQKLDQCLNNNMELISGHMYMQKFLFNYLQKLLPPDDFDVFSKTHLLPVIEHRQQAMIEPAQVLSIKVDTLHLIDLIGSGNLLDDRATYSFAFSNMLRILANSPPQISMPELTQIGIKSLSYGTQDNQMLINIECTDKDLSMSLINELLKLYPAYYNLKKQERELNNSAQIHEFASTHIKAVIEKLALEHSLTQNSTLTPSQSQVLKI